MVKLYADLVDAGLRTLDQVPAKWRAAVEEELADILNYTLQMVAKLNLDPIEIVRKKMKKNAIKYPVEKSKGSSAKYDKL